MRVVHLLLWTAAAGTPLAAQQADPFPTGLRVRVLHPDGVEGTLTTVSGRLAERTGEHLLVEDELTGRKLRIPLGRVLGIERDAGQARQTLKLSLFAASFGQGLVGTLAAGAAGAATGASIRQTRWTRVPLSTIRPDLEPGMLVRLRIHRSHGGEELEGIVSGTSRDSVTLVLRDGNTHRQVAREAIRDAAWPNGARRAGSEGMLIGLGAGLLGGALLVQGSSCDDRDVVLFSCGQLHLIGIGAIASTGAAFGALFGSLVRKLHWEKGQVPRIGTEPAAVDWVALSPYLVP